MNKPEISNGWYIFRFALIFLLSIVVMLSDIKLKVMSDFRYYLETALYPVMVFADSPRSITDAVTEQFKSREALISENEQLARELYTQRADLLRLKSLELENAHMRKLLNTPLQEMSKRMVGIVLDVNIDPYLKRVVINRGTGSGVYVGMPVITEKGLVGQVISANYASSQVLLLIDSVSSVPVMNLRSQIRAIASGVGVHDLLSIDNVPRNADIKVGDVLVTSGLGGVYPAGYPVAVVTEVGGDKSATFASVKAAPLVDFDQIRYVLMLWVQDDFLNENSQESLSVKSRTDSKNVLKRESIRKALEKLSLINPKNSDMKKEAFNG
ncbi:rod shape-determining protein MreC [Succinatimonas hippei]|uniref:rod shape-determining protein MreC n=1 Tax=Succinatimonas hippei TaxID=626938 RepID=UPI002492D7E3|nr:rod shape-determining protein MreC [Succinatimonas hippei]